MGLPAASAALALPLTLLAALSLPPVAHAQIARIELYALRTTTLTDQQFLNGVKEGQPATIAAELRLPRRTTDRMPPESATFCRPSTPTRTIPSIIPPTRSRCGPSVPSQPLFV
jgi:hypothetical protein